MNHRNARQNEKVSDVRRAMISTALRYVERVTGACLSTNGYKRERTQGEFVTQDGTTIRKRKTV